jgi:TrmH family RNA methyltransferase
VLIDPKAAKVRGVAKLVKKEARRETGLFLLEGPQGFREALERPKLVLEAFATEEALARHDDLFAKAKAARIDIQLVSEQVLAALSDTNTPQGVVAVCHQFDVSLEDVIATKPKLVALLSQIRDPGNAGTVLRAADAAGADAVIFTEGSVDIYNTKVVRSTTGSMFHLPFVIDVDINEAVAALKAAGIQVLAADASGDALPELATEGALDNPTAWMFGNEAWGFEPEILKLADRVVAVPIYGAAESLNLATAASVCLYSSAFQQNSATS